MTMPSMRPATPKTNAVGRPLGVRERSAQATRDSILRAAIRVFAKHGFSGGSIEKISKSARSVDRMIYYYFGNKEGLFVAVIEEIYRRFNVAESALTLDPAAPVEALQAMIRFVIHYYRDHPEFVSLLNSENLHRGKHIAKSLRAREYSSPAVGTTERILRSGIGTGVFRPEISARDLYLLIAAAGYFHQSNRFTLSAFLGEDLEAPAALDRWESFVIDMVLRGVSRDPPKKAARR
jgi:TetR/AcrR family transcriptional regulator, upper aerobic nicotinate degradation pathway regulator